MFYWAKIVCLFVVIAKLIVFELWLFVVYLLWSGLENIRSVGFEGPTLLDIVLRFDLFCVNFLLTCCHRYSRIKFLSYEKEENETGVSIFFISHLLILQLY